MSALNRYRSEFPITKRFTFMNHAAVSPLPTRAVNATESLFREFSHYGIARYPHWEQRVREVRGLFADLINADVNEVAFVGSTSEGLSTVASGLQWKKGDIVLVPDADFPANIYPWMNLEQQGVEIRSIPKNEGRYNIKDIESVFSPRTRLISVSSVDFFSGFYCDLDALGQFCKKKGILFCVDAIQSLGLIPMDVKKLGIHFLAAGGHKWLLSTMGCGGLFISKEVNHLIHPDRVGWKSVLDEEDFFSVHFHLKPDALRFEPGTMNMAGIYCLGAAIELLLEAGVERIHKNVLTLTDIIFQELLDRKVKIISPTERNERSGIVSFVPSSTPALLWRYFNENNIMVSLRENVVRLSPHFYNNNDDVSHFLNVLDSFHDLNGR